MENHGEGGSSFVQHRPLPQSKALLTENGENIPFSMHLSGDEPLDVPVEQFIAMLRFEQRDKLAELPIDLNRSGRDDFF